MCGYSRASSRALSVESGLGGEEPWFLVAEPDALQPGCCSSLEPPLHSGSRPIRLRTRHVHVACTEHLGEHATTRAIGSTDGLEPRACASGRVASIRRDDAHYL